MPDRVRCAAGGAMVADGDRWVAVHSRNPIREAHDLVVVALQGRKAGVLVVIGLGLGYVLDALEQREWSGRVLALEPEPELLPFFHARRNWSGWLEAGRLRVLAAPDYPGAADCWPWFDDSGAEPPVIVNAPLARTRGDATRRARETVARLCFDARANANARREHGARYLLNTLGNLPALAREGDVASLVGAARDVPAVVVAAGPSLDGNLEALRALSERALVIAVDTAARPLLAAGVSPHLVVAVDPSESNARHLIDLPACTGTHLVAEASVDPQAIEGFPDRTFLFGVADHEPWPWLRTHGAGRGRLRAWGSVLTSAFDLAVQMGCDPIVFAGADLAFSGDRPYARGVVYEADWRRLAEYGVPYDEQWRAQIDAWPFTEEPDVHGTLVRTAPQLRAFRNWIAEQAGHLEGRRVINGTGAGILHGRSVKQAALADLAATLPLRGSQLAALVRGRYAPASGASILDAARSAAADSAALRAWTAFAADITASGALDAIDRALTRRRALAPAVPHPTARATVYMDTLWSGPLAESLPLVAMPIPRHRMDHRASGVRVFRFQTTTARLVGCLLRLPDEAVAEDGIPLRRAGAIDEVRDGEFFIWRDEVHFRSTDGSDPRRNGRAYTVLVPEAIAHVERLPIGEILHHHL